MEESFLHFIWKFQLLNSRELQSDAGQEIVVLHPGNQNTDAGPDFSNAKIKIGDIIWNGNVEIHINSKDWYRHNHQSDDSYYNIVLHIVWKNDASIKRKDKTIIPTLELKKLVDHKLILKYNQLFVPGDEILCHQFIESVKSITILNMLDKTLAQRLEKKSTIIIRQISMTNGDWEEISWRLLCGNFGFKTNAYPFEELAKSLPFKILKRESLQENAIEALLFGKAGFLEECIEDSYFKELKMNYVFLQKKYKLERRLDKHQWKFLRLRPGNFPTVRIAQLAKFVANHKSLFSFLINYSTIKELKNGLNTIQSTYWQEHYNFGVSAKSHVGKLGSSSIDNILINTVAPLLFAYGIYKDKVDLKEKAMELLASVKPEINSITKKWKALEFDIKSAFDSQALIELYNEFCKKKRCLNCSIGVDIIKSS